MLKLEERETILRYDVLDKKWYAYSSHPAHINRMKKRGWELVREESEFGSVTAAEFIAPPNAVTFRGIKDTEAEEADTESETDA